MKGLKALAKATASGRTVPLYYSIKEDKVYTEEGNGRFFLTNLINKNTEKDIEKTVHYMMSL